MQFFPRTVCNVTAWRHSRLRAHWLMAPRWGWEKYVFCVPRELQRLLFLFCLWEESVGGAHGGRILWRRCINFLLSYSYTSTWYFWGFVRQSSWVKTAWYEWVHWLPLWWPVKNVQTGFARSKLSRGSLMRVSSLAAALMALQWLLGYIWQTLPNVRDASPHEVQLLQRYRALPVILPPWRSITAGENSLHWKVNMLPLFSIMTLWSR